jgi:hypothetical protein
MNERMYRRRQTVVFLVVFAVLGMMKIWAYTKVRPILSCACHLPSFAPLVLRDYKAVFTPPGYAIKVSPRLVSIYVSATANRTTTPTPLRCFSRPAPA